MIASQSADTAYTYDAVGRLLKASQPGAPAGTNRTTIGFFNQSSATWYERNSNTSGGADASFTYGAAGTGTLPVVGDWNGNGTDTIGTYTASSGVFSLRNSNSTGSPDITPFTFGVGGSNILPIIGDWNGDGVDTVGIYDKASGTFSLKNTNSNGAADLTFVFGGGGSTVLPIAGDWNGDGIDTIGIFNTATGAVFLKNTNASGVADVTFVYGPAVSSFLPVAGDWNGDGVDTIGGFDTNSGTFYLRNSNSNGAADLTFTFGGGGSGIRPVVGDWDGLAALGTGPTFARRYEYDRWGNRTKLWTNTAGKGSPRQTVSLATQTGTIPNNRIASVTDSGVPQTYVTDLAGNVTSDGHTYAYDVASRIVSVNSTLGTYAYDVANRRTKKTTGGSTTHYVWDGGHVIGEYNGATGAPLVEYLYAGGAMIARDTGNGTTTNVPNYYHSDRLSIRAITDGSGNVVWSGAHDPYGEDVGSTGPAANKHRFTTYERDSESGTDYAVNRQYASGVGRFLRPDPVSGIATDPASLNRLAYCIDDPVNRADPLGLDTLGDAGAVTAALTAPGPLATVRPEERPGYLSCIETARRGLESDFARNSQRGLYGNATAQDDIRVAKGLAFTAAIAGGLATGPPLVGIAVGSSYAFAGVVAGSVAYALSTVTEYTTHYVVGASGYVGSESGAVGAFEDSISSCLNNYRPFVNPANRFPIFDGLDLSYRHHAIYYQSSSGADDAFRSLYYLNYPFVPSSYTTYGYPSGGYYTKTDHPVPVIVD